MATDTQQAAAQEETPAPAPPLRAGDRLTRDEFERRYNEMPEINKAELVEGVVYMPSPVSAEGHGVPHFKFNGWLFLYDMQTPTVEGGDNSSLKLDIDNMPQPDGYLRLLPEHGGQSKIVEGYIEGPPELILEVAASTESHDLHDKFNAYRRNGVREYLVWRVRDRAIDWFVLRQGRYERLQPDENGIFKSTAFPGLWLDAAALVDRDMPRVAEVLRQGTSSREHAEFVSG